MNIALKAIFKLVLDFDIEIVIFLTIKLGTKNDYKNKIAVFNIWKLYLHCGICADFNCFLLFWAEN